MSNEASSRRIGRPRGADADQTRTAILDAALAAFAERGFEGASIREITGSVGVGHNLVRHYFGSKEDLWRAAVRHGLQPAADRIGEILTLEAGRPLRPTLRAALELLMVEAAANPDAFRLFLAESLRGGTRFDQIYDDVLEPLARTVFEYAAGAEEIPATADMRVVALFVFSAALSPFTFEGFASRLGIRAPVRGEPLDAQIEDLIDMISDEQREHWNPVPVEQKAGDCTWHHGLTFHFTRPNTTEHVRRAVVTIYIPEGVTFAADEKMDGPLSSTITSKKGEPLRGSKFLELA